MTIKLTAIMSYSHVIMDIKTILSQERYFLVGDSPPLSNRTISLPNLAPLSSGNIRFAEKFTGQNCELDNLGSSTPIVL